MSLYNKDFYKSLVTSYTFPGLSPFLHYCIVLTINPHSINQIRPEHFPCKPFHSIQRQYSPSGSCLAFCRTKKCWRMCAYFEALHHNASIKALSGVTLSPSPSDLIDGYDGERLKRGHLSCFLKLCVCGCCIFFFCVSSLRGAPSSRMKIDWYILPLTHIYGGWRRINATSHHPLMDGDTWVPWLSACLFNKSCFPTTYTQLAESRCGAGPARSGY